MNPKIIYDFPPIFIDKEKSRVESFLMGLVDFDDCEDFRYVEECDYESLDPHVERRWYVHHVYNNGDSVDELYSIWFDGEPVMVVCDWESNYREFITNESTYLKLKEYAESFLVVPKLKIHNENEEISDLTELYNKMQEYYNPNGVNPKYKVGDIVMCEFDYPRVLSDETKDIKTFRVLINQIFPYNPCRTYNGVYLDLDHDWSTHRFVYKKDSRGGRNFWGNDSDIEGYWKED